MPRFFENQKLALNADFMLNKENSQHCSKVLRMRENDQIEVCNGGEDYICNIVNISADCVTCKVVEIKDIISEPSVDVALFQCLPKGDKLESVIQKSVELGVKKIVPVLSSRCVSRPDEKKSAKKTERYNKIAKSACEQSGRGHIVTVEPTISFKQALSDVKSADISIMFYEGGGEPIAKIMEQNADKLQKCGDNRPTVAIMIGPEGGFSDEEVELARNSGIINATLGKRILRTETAPLAAITTIMLLSGNME